LSFYILIALTVHMPLTLYVNADLFCVVNDHAPGIYDLYHPGLCPPNVGIPVFYGRGIYILSPVIGWQVDRTLSLTWGSKLR